MAQTSKVITKDLKEAFNIARLSPLAHEAGAIAQKTILDRTAKGKFLGGSYQSKGYSSNPIYAWKLGRTKWDGSSLSIKKEFVAPVKAASNELKWTNKGAILMGGYKRFRELARLNSGSVDLSFTGRMLNSLQFSVKKFKNRLIVTLNVSKAQDTKAFYTNAKREWLSLDDSEIGGISKFISDKIERMLK